LRYSIDKIFISKESKGDNLTAKIIEKLPGVEVEEVSNYKPVKEYALKNFEDPVGQGKKILYLARNRGVKIKSCPCTKNVVSCGYYIINLQAGCPIDCSYCILQSYLNNPFITVFTNLDDYMSDISLFLERHKENSIRVGTGELTDSLALDELTDLSTLLIDLFRNYSKAQLELKTKSDMIENLLNYHNPTQNIVIAWSLNPEGVIEKEERGAATLKERLLAAKICAEKGYRLAFHFDPIILFDGYQKAYGDLIDQVFGEVGKYEVLWWSLGGLRFDSSLKPTVLERFRNSSLLTGDFLLCRDNKYRYPDNERVEAFNLLSGLIKGRFPKVSVYLCMEEAGIWRRTEFNLNKACFF
jgi:spore photoproduct lyase